MVQWFQAFPDFIFDLCPPKNSGTQLYMSHSVRKAEGAGPFAQTGGFQAAAVLEELDCILRSREFVGSERHRRFLRHVVDETLAGRADHIKAYSLATSVFDRDQNFDPQTDPIVRIEAGRLRRALEHYYLTEGIEDKIRITIPKGAYVPLFTRADGDHAKAEHVPAAGAETTLSPSPTPEREASGRKRVAFGRKHVFALGFGAVVATIALTWLAVSWLGGESPVRGRHELLAQRGPVILVVPFHDDSAGSAQPHLARGLTREVILGLSRFKDLFVLGPETSFELAQVPDPIAAARSLRAEYIVAGGLTVSQDRYRVTASLIDAGSGQYIWSEGFEGSLLGAEILTSTRRVSDQIVQALAQRYGVIFNETGKEIAGRPPDSFSSYECVLLYQYYRRKLTRDLFGQVRDCLERTIVKDPAYGNGFSSLSQLYADAYRYNFDGGGSAPGQLTRALELAKEAVRLSPYSVDGYTAMHSVYWQMNEVQLSFEAGEKGIALNPNDTEILAAVGMHYCLTGAWTRGLPLVEAAFAGNPGQNDVYRIPLVLHHYIEGRYAEALTEAKKIGLPDVIYTHVLLAMTHAQLGHTSEAAAAVAAIRAIDSDYGDHVVTDLRKRNVHPDLIQTVVEGLRKAGL